MTGVKVTKLTKCLACGGEHLELILDLGNQPPANSYKDTPEEVQEEFPLAINLCTDCYHVQLTDVVDPDLLYKNYLYVSGTSQTMKDHCEWFARFVTERTGAHNVLDIGCNDGTQLDAFRKLGYRTFGIDPATNLCKISGKNHTVFNGYFEDFDDKIWWYEKQGFSTIIAQNVFAHNTNPLAFLKKAKSLLPDSGLIFIQTSQADMILNNEFDTIYHEHISFYNINSMNELCKRAGLNLIDVVKCPLHGNSYIFVISLPMYPSQKLYQNAHIENLIAMERKSGLYTRETYNTYAKKCQALVTDLKSRIEFYTRNEIGYLAIGYGAAAKGMTLLNYADIKLDYIIDDNPLKQGKYTPGLGIPIVSSKMLQENCDTSLFIPLAWNFFDEISNKIIAQRKNDYDLFVKYFPRVQIIKAKEMKNE